MTVVCGFTAKTKSKKHYASVTSMTKPVLKLHVNAPNEEKMQESSFVSHESMEVDEQDAKDSDLDEDDIEAYNFENTEMKIPKASQPSKPRTV